MKIRRSVFVGDFVFCPSCSGFSNLLAGVKKITGVIGGDMKTLKIDEDILFVPLWDEHVRKASGADIDLLSIQANGIENYHFAVNAVIIELTAAPLPRKKIPIHIEENTRLPNDVIRMLEDFGNIQDRGY